MGFRVDLRVTKGSMQIFRKNVVFSEYFVPKTFRQKKMKWY